MKSAILKFSGKSVDALVNNLDWAQAIGEIQNVFDGVAIVHGGGKQITEWSTMFGLEPRFVDGQRITSAPEMDIVAGVSGLINSKLVAALNAQGIPAIGLNGATLGSITATALNDDWEFTGIPKLNGSANWVFDLFTKKITPVFSCVCSNLNGQLMNVNADLFTNVLAEWIRPDLVCFFSDVDGVRTNGVSQNELTVAEIDQAISDGDITEGMIPKIKSCVSILEQNIQKVWIGPAHPAALFEILSGKTKSGTWILNDEVSYV